MVTQLLELEAVELRDVGDSNFEKIDKLNCDDIIYFKFFEQFISRNIPCVVENICSSWNATSKWTDNDIINYNYLIHKYGDKLVSVANCDKINFGAQCKQQMFLKEFVQYMKNKSKDSLLYLKDWHLKKDQPYDEFYVVPDIFKSDWLNEYADDNNEDDFKFVYIGPKDSWTPLHADVYSSFSWSANVIGRKHWTLFPPGEEDKMIDDLGNLPLMYKREEFPSVKSYEIIQEKGEAIFVPSCWYHQVVNLEDTISINHNWVNGCNISYAWKSLQNNLRQVENEIIDLKDDPEYDKQCQIILKSLSGMDYKSFINLITYITNKRIRQITNKDSIFGTKHILFDLLSILYLIDSITTDPVFDKNTLKTLIYPLTDLKLSINSIKNNLEFES